jgi:hypothetical protein
MSVHAETNEIRAGAASKNMKFNVIRYFQRNIILTIIIILTMFIIISVIYSIQF